jgi:NDP-sugar pyrophosphorylase family protein
MNERTEDGWPLTLTRRMEDFPIGNRRLADWLETAGEELREMISACLFPWDLLAIHEKILAGIEDEISGEIHPSALVGGRLKLGKGSRILPGVFIEGNVVIGEGCKIGPNCYVRGNTSIGDRCHIGQSVEVKNSIILSDTNVGHLSYVGDSILGENVNFGAGTIVSNYRHDGGNHRSMVNGRLVDTGRRKFGAIIGDGVYTGIGTLIYPGRKIWPNMSTRPGEVVQRDLRL